MEKANCQNPEQTTSGGVWSGAAAALFAFFYFILLAKLVNEILGHLPHLLMCAQYLHSLILDN